MCPEQGFRCAFEIMVAEWKFEMFTSAHVQIPEQLIAGLRGIFCSLKNLSNSKCSKAYSMEHLKKKKATQTMFQKAFIFIPFCFEKKSDFEVENG